MTSEQKAMLRFPGFTDRAVTFSYDDGVVYDERLIAIFDHYGMKATFNLNSGLFSEWRRLSEQDAVRVYGSGNHEIAVHGEKHLHLSALSRDEVSREIGYDRNNLKRIFGVDAVGMAYAYGDYNPQVIRYLRDEGIRYARTVKATLDFGFPEDWLAWHPTCHHNDERLQSLIAQFAGEDAGGNGEAKLLYIWGHSYEFNDNDNWFVIEDACSRLAAVPGLWKATNGAVYRYVNAFLNIEYAKGERLYNPSPVDLYLCINDRNIRLPAGKEINF